jgi:hypothetical protein
MGEMHPNGAGIYQFMALNITLIFDSSEKHHKHEEHLKNPWNP